MRVDSPFPFRYRRLAYVALEVTDLSRSVRFYRDFLGLEVVESDSEVAYLRCSRDRQNVVLYATPTAGPRRGLRRIAYQVDSKADLDVAFAHFECRGLDPQPVSRTEQARLHQGRSFRVREPSSGVQLELFADTAALETSYVAGRAAIIGLGHVVIGSAREEETQRSLVDAFGFRVADVVEGHRAFLRAHPGGHQCSLAVGLGSRRAVPVVSFVVSDIGHLGRIADPDGIVIECNIAIDEACDGSGVDSASKGPSSAEGPFGG